MKKIILLLSCEENNLWVFGSDTSIPVYDVAKTLLSDLEKKHGFTNQTLFREFGQYFKRNNIHTLARKFKITQSPKS